MTSEATKLTLILLKRIKNGPPKIYIQTNLRKIAKILPVSELMDNDQTFEHQKFVEMLELSLLLTIIPFSSRQSLNSR